MAKTSLVPHELVTEIWKSILEIGELTSEQIRETWGLDQDEYARVRRELDSRPSIEAVRKVGGFRATLKKSREPVDGGMTSAESSTNDWGSRARHVLEGVGLLARRTRTTDGDASSSREFEITSEVVTGTHPRSPSSWQQRTIVRLSEVLEYESLEALLGPLVSMIRRLRKERDGEDRRGTKRELAEAVLLRFDRDLFAEKQLRDLVAKSLRIESPGRWHPGKVSAAEFVKLAGFPIETAGDAVEDERSDYEYLEPAVDLRPLEPFQEEAMERLLQLIETSAGRAVLSLPTGAGKTRVAVDALHRWFKEYLDETDRGQRRAILWLAHTEELCEQAHACFKQVWQGKSGSCPLMIVRFWGKFTSDLARHGEVVREFSTRPCVLISTPQRIVALLRSELQSASDLVTSLMRALAILVIDEAHRAAAPSYRAILDRLIANESPASVIGLTATPFRIEYKADPFEGTKELLNIFEGLVEPERTLGADVRGRLQEMGVLARPVSLEIATKTNLRMPADVDVESEPFDEGSAERIDKALAIHADNTPRRLRILDYISSLAGDPTALILYFGPSVRDAEAMAYMIRSTTSLTAAVVSAETRESTRRAIVEDFKRRRVRVLCNCEVLTTGFDAPLVTHVIIGRPTVSRVLYEQMAGRALRGPKFGGTERAYIVDCVDGFRGPRPRLGYDQFRAVWKPDLRDVATAGASRHRGET